MVKKFLTTLFLFVYTFHVYGETFCGHFEPDVDEDVSGREWLSYGSGSQYLYCGYHDSDNGCPDGAEVFAKGDSGWGVYHCYENGPTWAYIDPDRWIADCADDQETEHDRHDRRFRDYDYVYFADSNAWDRLYHICKISRRVVETNYYDKCESTGGGAGHIFLTKCFCAESYGLKHKETPMECECIDTDAHLDETNGHKVCVRGNFYACETDADCLAGRTPVKPAHSTAWRCVNQKYDVKVCAATDCDDGWHVKSGYGFCEKDEPQQTSQTQETPTTASTPTIGTHNAATAFTKKTCSDVINMDSNCKCTIVPETVEQNGKCVCSDSNKEIKNGKCEYTATYISTLQSGINNTYDSLRATMSGFKVNVWRDEQGNFNTARLASDSIAGVVLGTVGGIVTANVVKKAQVKQGFEDMKCSIGGQSVANFGDEFTVGR